jgi:SAM-dependent methyltransferase
LELYRDNLQGALTILVEAEAQTGDPCYATEARRVRSWLLHLHSWDAYRIAYEHYYAQVKRQGLLKRLDRAWRTLIGRKTRKTVQRVSGYREYQLLEQELRAVRARRVLDAGCGEGRIAITLGARHPGVQVGGVEATATNTALARKVNRCPNVRFRQGLIEELDSTFKAHTFDMAYAFGVLEHVPNVEMTVAAMLRLLRPGGRCCFVVPMVEFVATGPIPEFAPPDGVAGHVRVFSKDDLRRFATHPKFTLHKVPGTWQPGRYPTCFVPKEFGAFFVAFSQD